MTKNEQIGLKVTEFFKLKSGYGFMEGRYDTSWGSKTLEGIGASVIRMVEEGKENESI